MRHETLTQKRRDQCGKTEAGIGEGKSREQQKQDGVERGQRQWGNETGLKERRGKMRKRGTGEVDSREIQPGTAAWRKESQQDRRT